MAMVFYTVGVYGSTEQEFFEKLLKNEIDTFIDIRRRRAVRGPQYSFANSNKLQDKLANSGISYMHILELSPTNEIRNMQYAEDEKSGTSQRKRQSLSKVFISAYKNQILKHYSLDSLISELKAIGSKRAVLFCVEKNPGACHRSLVAEKLERDYNMKAVHLL